MFAERLASVFNFGPTVIPMLLPDAPQRGEVRLKVAWRGRKNRRTIKSLAISLDSVKKVAATLDE